jgi:DNA-binding NarL/FixJ family response regulator
MPKTGLQSEDFEAVSVVLVDDHDLFRSGLRDILEAEGLRVVAQASDGRRGIELVAELAPDVAVMDLNMPEVSGIEATRAITARTPATRVLVLTISADDASVMEAMIAGASGYLLKDAAVEDLVAGIRAAANGEAAITPRIAAKLLTWLRESHAARPLVDAAPSKLSERELDVLRLLAKGMANAEIAEVLVISPKTVKNHIASILVKLQIENRIQAAVYAVKSGIV